MILSRLLKPRGARLAVLAALAVTSAAPLAAQAAGGPSVGGCNVTPDKCYSFSMSVAGSPGPGQDALYTGTLKNLSQGGTGVTLGSANITWSPSDAFYSVTPGTVSVSPAGSGTPTEAVNGATLELRNLSAAPGATVTFTFHATALKQETVTWYSAAKQANNFAGVGNDQTGGSTPVTSVSGSCSGSVAYNAYGCSGFPIAQGGKVCTGSVDDANQPSKVTSCITFPPVPGATGFQVMALRTYLGGDACPVDPVSCTYTTQLLNKLNAVYTGAYTATIDVSCGSLCSPTTAYFQQEESTGTTEPLLPCAVTEAVAPVTGGPLASPLTSSTACVTTSSDGSWTVPHVSFLNDYKVMGMTVLGG